MWLNDLRKGLTVTFLGVDHNWYVGIVAGWTGEHVSVYHPDTDKLYTAMLSRVHAVERQGVEYKKAGDTICLTCMCRYSHHAKVWVLTDDNQETDLVLNKLCDGRYVQL